MIDDKLVGWHHRFNGHEFEQTLGDVEGQGSLAFYSPWDCRVEYDLVTEQQQRACRPQDWVASGQTTNRREHSPTH